ncbi:ATP-binding cassette domain-containing protein [Curtobacterium sp. TC1]|uniref:ABC transporter ATP-binding protein n=1 Tax=Curtobacterium sp. TC1 TaxID=2862880 RepID=UPI001C9A90B4|nr:ATP-binding cassette domain-containing protein [Curtobacterium sp. TC1]QZQ56809.1 ATP-binding cassette domain-containing protein [Curtobacterium sp. TC1]
MTEQLRLRAEGIGYDIAGRTLWDGVSFQLRAGEALALRGPSGQGKSTMLRCLGGLEQPTRGRITIDGNVLQTAGEGERRALRRDTVGLVMQDHAVVPEWTVTQNLRVLRPSGVARAELGDRIDEALRIVGLGGRRTARAGTMSGGEQQRVAVARVLAQRPRLVLADEPTASLDSESAARVSAGLDALRASGSAVVVATHDPALIAWAGAELALAVDATT